MAPPLHWHDLTAELVAAPNNRKLLDGACGSAHPGRVLAIIGPSGAGKTTLLQLLAGRLERSRNLRISGSVDPPPAVDAPASFVYQDDAFLSRLTVEETLRFAAAIRLPPKACDGVVQRVASEMGLQEIAASVVGSGRVRGISGGERKRLAIGCELCGAETAGSAALFADEPTSGLDSFQARRIVRALRGAAQRGRVVVLTVHQPSARLLESFDDLLLLGAGGRDLFLGPVAQLVPSLAAARGSGDHRPPQLLASITEWALELASVDPSAPAESRARVDELAESWRRQRGTAAPPPSGAGPARRSRSPARARTGAAAAAEARLEAVGAGAGAGAARSAFAVQLRWCAWRAWRQAMASPRLLAMRLLATAVTPPRPLALSEPQRAAPVPSTPRGPRPH